MKWHLCIIEEVIDDRRETMRAVCETGEFADAMSRPHRSVAKRHLAFVQKIFPGATELDFPDEAIDRAVFMLDQTCDARHRIVQ